MYQNNNKNSVAIMSAYVSLKEAITLSHSKHASTLNFPGFRWMLVNPLNELKFATVK